MDGDVGRQPPLDGVREPSADRRFRLRKGHVRAGLESLAIMAALPIRAVRLDREKVPRSDGPDIGERRQFFPIDSERRTGEIARVEGTRDAVERVDRLDLRGEHDLVRRDGIVQRLDAARISAGDQASLPCVPEQEGELALQVLKEIGTVLFVKVDEQLGVGRGAELVASIRQAATQLFVVVQFAVADRGDGIVFVVKGLFAAVQIDDAESNVPQTDAPAIENRVSRSVGSAMRDGGAHSRQVGGIDGIVIPSHDRRDSAHESEPRC